MYCPSSFIISYRHPCAVLQLGHPRVHPFLGLATILVPLSVLPGPQCYLYFPLVNSVSLRFSFLTVVMFMYSHSGYSCSCIHIQAFRFGYTGLGIQASLYTQTCIVNLNTLNVNTECECFILIS